LAPRRRLLRLAIVEGAGAQSDGTVKRGDQLRHQALHGGILDRDETVGEKLRARQHVAQIVADLAYRETERGEPGFLRQRLDELMLHGGELALGGADLVAAGPQLEYAPWDPPAPGERPT